MILACIIVVAGALFIIYHWGWVRGHTAGRKSMVDDQHNARN